MFKRISRYLTLAIMLVAIGTSFSTGSAQSSKAPLTDGVTGSDPEPIKPIVGSDPEFGTSSIDVDMDDDGVTGSDPEPIKPVTGDEGPNYVQLSVLVLFSLA